MIGYITLGTNDMQKAAAFYDALLESVGVSRMMEGENFIAWGPKNAPPWLSIIKPYDGQPASVGNGVMVAFAMDAPEKVDAFYAKAIELGAADEGAAGPRGDQFYAGYFRDFDGNKLNAFCMTG
ncbi:MAG: VOC family protein [Woeseiaceae bacterium]|nr:VOC family protein [Woeseiaceae bacterium]